MPRESGVLIPRRTGMLWARRGRTLCLRRGRMLIPQRRGMPKGDVDSLEKEGICSQTRGMPSPRRRGNAELVPRRAAVAGARRGVEPAAIGCCAEVL